MYSNPDVALAVLGLPGGSEWLVIMFVALLLFGSRLPSIMRGLGGSVREFKKGMEGDITDHKPIEGQPATPPATPPVDGSVSRPSEPPKDPSKN